MRLSKRLQTIHDMVKPGGIVADIGCDHALLPIALIESHTCDKAYACDVNEGPLKRAKEAIAEANKTAQIIPLLCDGLEGLNDDVTTVVIAGMGYDTITHILGSQLDKAKSYQQIIIQCNNHVTKLRQWLHEHGFAIDAEQLVKEHHYYQMISVHAGEQEMQEDQYMFGIYLDHHPLFRPYWEFQLHKQKKILERLHPEHESYAKTKNTIIKIKIKLKELC